MTPATEVFKQKKQKTQNKFNEWFFCLIPSYDAIFFETTFNKEKRGQLTQISVRNHLIVVISEATTRTFSMERLF